MKRYHVTLGADTTVGGKVVSASSMISIHGVKVALEGDQIACPACKRMGKIRCMPPRLKETCDGKSVALTDDLCICGCVTPPRLKASQTSNYQNMGAAFNGLDETSVCNKGSDVPSNTADYDLVFEVTSEVDGQPLVDYPYEIGLPDGTLVVGRTDRSGLTEKITACAVAEATLKIFSPSPSPVDPYWDRDYVS